MLASALGGVALATVPWSFALDKPPPLGVRRGTTQVRGKSIAWRAETGETVMLDTAGRPEATMFSVAYMGEGQAKANRPVTFIWNGGPGSATWHLREEISPRTTIASKTPPGYAFADNRDSIIDASDLVFIDAPGMGFSRILRPEARTRYHGIEEDGRAFAEFIARWLKSHDRIESPIYLMGESYGGTRAGQVARNLAEWHIALSGVVLVSPALGATELGEDDPQLVAQNVPSQACVAWYHKRGAHTASSLQDMARDAETFANGPLTQALANRSTLSATAKRAMAEQLSGFIGIRIEDILKANLVVTNEAFSKALFADRNLDANAYDGRQLDPKPEPGEEVSVLTPDEGFNRTASIEALVREDLGYPALGAYTRDPSVTDPWNGKTTRTANTDEILRDEMRVNPQLRVLLMAGYFDLTVPYAGPLQALRAALPPQRFKHHLYATGHAVFEDASLRAKTTAELATWYATRVA